MATYQSQNRPYPGTQRQYSSYDLQQRQQPSYQEDANAYQEQQEQYPQPLQNQVPQLLNQRPLPQRQYGNNETPPLQEVNYDYGYDEPSFQGRGATMADGGGAPNAGRYRPAPPNHRIMNGRPLPRPQASPTMPLNNDSAFPPFPGVKRKTDPTPAGSLPLDDAMLNMNLNDGTAPYGPPSLKRTGPPPNVMRRPPLPPPHGETSGFSIQNRFPPGQRQPMPLKGPLHGPPLQGGRQQTYPRPGPPPVRQYRGNPPHRPQDQVGWDDGYDAHYQDNINAPPPLNGLQQRRSMTMPTRPPRDEYPPLPTNHSQMHNMASGLDHYGNWRPAHPGQHAGPSVGSIQRGLPSIQQLPAARTPEHYDYQVNDAPDSYYENVEHYDGQQDYGEDSHRSSAYSNHALHYHMHHGSLQDGGYYNELHGSQDNGPYWHHPHANNDFAAQAYRSRSQPNLRLEQSRQVMRKSSINGNEIPPPGHPELVEMMGDIPPVPPVPPIPENIPSQAELPAILRVRTPGPSQQNRTTPPAPPNMQKAQQAQLYTHKVQSIDSLPQYSSPTSLNRTSNPDSLPEHPTPIRPGLLQQDNIPMASGQSQMNPGHPPPIRQYSNTPSRESTESRGTAQLSTFQGPITQAELQRIQTLAKANPGDPKIQLALAKKYIEAADVLADEGGRADAKTTKKNRENYIFDAHKIIKKLSTSSHPYPEAMFFLASCYGDGTLGAPIDRERAFSLYHSAAKLNHAPSAYRTAVCCEIGAGTKKDPIKSVQWYKKAASLGDTGAMYKLGIILLKGLLGQQKSTRDALPWLKRAADRADEDNPHALHELALLYERTGDNKDPAIIPDADYARELFTRASELGYPPSQFRLAHAYEYGVLGCPIDPKSSIMWYSKAAMKGEPESELALSGWYLTGAEGVLEQSDTEAYLWARKAAEKGLMKAEYAVGHLTEAGFGVPPNLEEAKRWYYKAASQGFPKAQERLKDLKKGGSSSSQGKGQRLTRKDVRDRNKNGDECVVM